MKNSNLKLIVILSTFAFLLIAFNLALTLSPLQKLNFASFIIPLTFADTIVVFEAIAIAVITHKPERLSRKVLNLPALWFAYLVSTVALVVSTIIIVVNGFAAVDTWISLLVEIVMLAAALVLFLLPQLSKSSIAAAQEKRETKVSFYREASASINTIYAKAEKPELLSELIEYVQLSDKISTSESEVVEDKILAAVSELGDAVDASDEASIKDGSSKLLKLFKERSAVIKGTKQHH